ncbi:oxidoreductase [Antribacter gilvus]|uniref:oxidoreductase n=1 Tax=Antribacter gilvus TaxID=2304675 RepID=UPI000F7709A1|nr:oxidoreductase [Antribacter gilvus]
MPRQARYSLARFFQRRSPDSPRPASTPDSRRETEAHLRDFVATRTGVEAYVEPAHSQMPATLLLIATSGEWTRRRVPDERAAFDLGHALGVPVYNVRFTGYPQRMRDWTSAQRKKD